MFLLSVSVMSLFFFFLKSVTCNTQDAFASWQKVKYMIHVASIARYYFSQTCHLFSGNRVGRMVTFLYPASQKPHRLHGNKGHLLYLIVKTNDTCA